MTEKLWQWMTTDIVGLSYQSPGIILNPARFPSHTDPVLPLQQITRANNMLALSPKQMSLSSHMTEAAVQSYKLHKHLPSDFRLVPSAEDSHHFFSSLAQNIIMPVMAVS